MFIDPHVVSFSMHQFNFGGADGDFDGVGTTHAEAPTSGTLVRVATEGRLTVFSSAAAGFFAEREFQGLDPLVGAGASTEVRRGQFGIAAGYAQFEGDYGHGDRDLDEDEENDEGNIEGEEKTMTFSVRGDHFTCGQVQESPSCTSIGSGSTDAFCCSKPTGIDVS